MTRRLAHPFVQITLLAVVFFCSNLVQAADKQPLERLIEKLERVQSMQCNFSQLVLDKGGTRLQEATGKMEVARGNRFRWHTQTPFEQLVVSNGTTIWIHDIDLEQVVEKRLQQEAGNTPALLFSGDPQAIGESFNVSVADETSQQVTYQLVPTGEEPLFDVLEITFEAHLPASMRLEDALGQKTNIDFQDVQLNTDLPADTFRFSVPAGADLIQQ